MSKIWWDFLRVSLFFLGVTLVICDSATAQETVVELETAPTNQIHNIADKTNAAFNQDAVKSSLAEIPPIIPTDKPGDAKSSLRAGIAESSSDTDTDEAMSQVTNVSQLKDVQPGDWAYEAVRSLVEKYGVISGYPDGTFRGNSSMTRYEFAAGLKTILDRINQLVTANPNGISREDLATTQNLAEQFTLELALLRGRLDAATARIADLELTQFSRVTKLEGEVIFAGAGVIAGNNSNQTTLFGQRSRLNLQSSFNGRDLLTTRLQMEGFGSLTSNLTPEGELAFSGDTDSRAYIDALLYSFPIGQRTQAVLAGNANGADDFTNTVNPYFDGDGASGALSRFGTRNPIYYLVNGSGVGIQHKLSDKLEFSLGYLASAANNPPPDGGLFKGSYGAIAQVLFQPSQQSSIGLTYVNAYNNDLETGSTNANLVNQLNLPVVTNSYGIEASLQINPRFALGGWAGYTAARVINQGDANIWNWAVTLAFPDLGKKGNLGGIIVGMEPKVTGANSQLRNMGINDSDTSLHLEGFYQYQLTDNIVITPGLIWLTAPDHNSDNDDIVIGVVRTTFSF
ncbi:cyanobacterial porin [Crinalium epipsammum PCC 9333]|uniref:Cyanobacterial porin n=1 Tax=Crinalium epipsammum PCC 9333 TaxID=1173022 RepID=K9VYI7_9CYAN|nr:iron uptake porin [Crinalium epipsammum]AFZ12230.1 cyanobacterial porin [Crinalium epipsammum PCC 9333]